MRKTYFKPCAFTKKEVLFLLRAKIINTKLVLLSYCFLRHWTTVVGVGTQASAQAWVRERLMCVLYKIINARGMLFFHEVEHRVWWMHSRCFWQTKTQELTCASHLSVQILKCFQENAKQKTKSERNLVSCHSAFRVVCHNSRLFSVNEVLCYHIQ